MAAAATAKKEEKDERSVHERIVDITREMGVLEPQKSPGGGIAFAYRGVDATVAHVTPLLNKHGVFIYPSESQTIVHEREPDARGRVIKTTEVTVTYTVAGAKGDSFTMQTSGLADDFADRATAQAQSVAYRVALLQLFHIPASGKDPEETGQVVEDGRGEVGPRSAPAVEKAKAKAAGGAPAGVPITKLQAEAKALGKKLGKQPDDLNALGTKIAGELGVDDWFSNAGAMGKLVEALKAEDKA